MSALAAKSLGVGRNFARIFRVYNNLIYRHLQEIMHKNGLFSIKWGRKAQFSGQPKATKPLFIYKAQFAYKKPLAGRFLCLFSAFWCILPCILVLNAMRFDAKCNAFWC